MNKGEKIAYEWDIETFTLDEYEDITDHNHANCLADYGTGTFPLISGQRLVLVRDVVSDTEGLLDRQWAYIEDNQLPQHFSNEGGGIASKVPQKFHKALNVFISK